MCALSPFLETVPRTGDLPHIPLYFLLYFVLTMGDPYLILINPHLRMLLEAWGLETYLLFSPL